MLGRVGRYGLQPLGRGAGSGSAWFRRRRFGLHAEEALRAALEARPCAERLVYRVTVGTNDVALVGGPRLRAGRGCFMLSRDAARRTDADSKTPGLAQG